MNEFETSGKVEVQVVITEVDRAEDFVDMKTRIVSQIDLIRRAIGVSDETHPIELRTTLALPDAADVVIISDHAGHISISVDQHDEKIRAGFKDDEVTVGYGNAEPIAVGPTLEGVQAAAYIADVLQLYIVQVARQANP